MKAMILGAGKGTKIQPITDEIPNPMIPLIRKPIMEYLVNLLKKHGIQEIVVNTSHLAPAIECYFKDGKQFGVNMAYSYEGHISSGVAVSMPLGSAGGIKKIQDFSNFFDETFIVVYGDIWIDLDITKALEIHRKNKAKASVVVRKGSTDDLYRYGVVDLDDKNQVWQFQERLTQKTSTSNLISAGIYIFEPEILDLIPSEEACDLGTQLFPKLIEKKLPFFGINLPFQWLKVDSLRDVWDVTNQVLNGEIEGLNLPGKEVKPGVFIGVNVNIDFEKVNIQGPVYIGGSTKVEPWATIIGPTVIGSNCLIQNGAVIKNCIIEDYTKVGGAAELEKRIISGHQFIDPVSGSYFNVDEADIEALVGDVRKSVSASVFDIDFISLP